MQTHFKHFSQTLFKIERFQTLRPKSMKMAAFWDAAPCSLVDTDPDGGRCKLL
jgi:hypothetical protein